MIRYARETSRYLQVNESGQTVAAFEEVALVYQDDGETVFLRKHGEASDVQKWYDKERAKLEGSGMSEFARSIKILRSTKLPFEELNKCIEDSGYVGRMVQKFASLPAPADEFTM